MASATARAPQPGNEKGRLAGRPIPKLNFCNNSDTADNITPLRLQRLLACGIAGRRASLIASLAWGLPNHG